MCGQDEFHVASPGSKVLHTQSVVAATASMHRLGLTPYVDVYFGEKFEPHTCGYSGTEGLYIHQSFFI